MSVEALLAALITAVGLAPGAPPAPEVPEQLSKVDAAAPLDLGGFGKAPEIALNTALVQSTVSPVVDSVLACIRSVESKGSGGYEATSRTGKYRGAYQFSLSTWQSVGGRGDPAKASPAEQDHRASLLLEREGLKPWSGARHCQSWL